MRKFIVILMALALCLGMTVGAYAAEDTLSIPDVAVQQGQTVYVAVTLTESVTGDSVGITYSYDKDVLEAVPGSCTWGKQGMLQDFSRSDSGVWAVAQSQDLKGTLCVLAFQVKKGVTLTETTVTCTVTVKNDAETVGTYTATGRIYAVCDHNYAPWESGGELTHSQSCEHCGQTQTQTHVWDDGVVMDHPTDGQKDLLVHTCTVCGATREQEIADQGSAQVSTMPTQPVEEPEGPEITTFPQEAPETATRPPQQKPEDHGSVRPTEGQDPGTQNGQPGSQESSGNQNPAGSQGNAGSQTGSGQLTDYNQPGGNNQNSSGNQTGTVSQNSGGNQTGTAFQNNGGNQTGQVEQPVGSNAAESAVQDQTHDHVHEQNQNPVAVPIPEGVEIPEQTEIPDHTHAATEPEHIHETLTPEETGVSLLALLFAVLLVVGAAVLATILMKRIRHK